MDKLINEIKLRFEKALDSKNSWGKNEVKILYNNILIECLSENLNTFTTKTIE